MRDKACDMVKAFFAADSLALGVHWIYDADEIRNRHGRVDRLLAPGPGAYHPNRRKGEFTHYGDQTLVLLASVAASGRFDLDDFFRQWQNLFREYDGYVDSATRATLKQIEKGRGPDRCGSASNDLAGAARAVVLTAWLRHDPDTLRRAVRAQTRMTHQDPDTVDAADFFSLVSLACLNGTAPGIAMKEIAADHFADTPVEMWVDQGLAAAGRKSLEAILGFGQSCHTPEAFSGVVQLIARYADNLGEALVEAVMAGGDNAARAGLTAQVLAASNGMDDRTRQWFEGLVRARTISDLLSNMP